MVFTKRLELRVEFVDTILMCLACQFLHLICQLRGTRECNVQLGRNRRIHTRFRWTS